MDKNAVTGIVLITAMLMAWFYFFAPEPPPPVPPQARTTEGIETPSLEADSQAVVSAPEAGLLAGDSARLKDAYSDFFHLTTGTNQEITVKTDMLTATLNTKGGAFASVTLNEHRTYDSLPLPVVLANPENEQYFQFLFRNRPINSADLYFEPVGATDFTVSGEETQTLRLRAQLDEARYIEQVYTFKGNKYDIGYEIRLVGLDTDLKNTYYELVWANKVPRTELSRENLVLKTSLFYNEAGSISDLGFGEDPESEKFPNGLDWVAYRSQFFTATLAGEKPFRFGSLEMTSPPAEDPNWVRRMRSLLYVDIEKGREISNQFTFYMGPNEYNILSSYGQKFEKQMDMGWWIVGWINIGTVYVFKLFEKYISNYGIIILLFTVLVKLVVFPMTYKSYVSMAKMRVINDTPEMKALDEKFKEDPQKLQMEKMSVYRQMGVSPFGGCLPMLLQYPILIAMFFFFPQSVELRQKSFLWATDLSTYDSVLELGFTIPFYGDHVSLFTILMAISTFVYTLYSQKSQPAAMNAQMKYIAYIMPVFLLVFLNSYASGLSLYYFAANIITIAQTTGIRYFINDEKLLTEMREKQKLKSSKKGKGGKDAKGKEGADTSGKSRIERWVEGQQKKQKEVMKQRQQQAKGTSRSERRKNK